MIKYSDRDYLKGKKFSNGFIFELGRLNIRDRLEYLIQLVVSKNVLHIGFSDHLPLIKEKFNNNTWLHKRLIERSNICIGVDINAQAVSYCRNNLGIENIFHHDIVFDEKLLPQICENTWDYAILGEILEHVDNPVQFLAALKSRYGKYIKKLVVTVPNAWDIGNFKYIRNNKEYINSDHRYWFTPYTLSKVLTMAGYRVELIDPIDSFYSEKWVHRVLKKRYPMLSENLLAISEVE